MEKTSGAVNLLNITAQAGLSTLPNIGKAGQSVSDVSFSDALKKTSEVKPSENAKATEEIAKTKTVVDTPSKNTQANVKSSKDEVVQQKDMSNDEDALKENVDKISEAIVQIEQKIKDVFEVTDEEIEEAMEVLMISAVDLMNQTDLKNLVMELTGTGDSIELLTNVELYDNLKDVTTFVDELLTQISEEVEIPKEMLTEIINSDSFKDELSKLQSGDDNLNEVVSTLTNTDVNEEGLEEVANAKPEISEENILVVEGQSIKTPSAERNEGKISSDKVTESDENKVEVTVEINKTSETNVTKNNEANDMSQGEGNKKQNLFEKENNQHNPIQNIQTVTTQTVNSLGDIVETVTSYSSYTDTENIMRQVTDYVRVNITEDVTKMEMQLHPASLGTVNMQINSQNGQITAHLTVQNELVKSILESQMVKLQETFEEQGTKVTAIEVSVANYNLDSNDNGNYSQSGNNGNKKTGGRRGINLNEIDSFDELTDEEQLQAEVMEMNGSSVNYTA